MINDHYILIGTGILGAFFVICGLLDIMDNMLIKLLLFGGYIAIIVCIIIIKSKDEDEKNLLE